MDDASKSTNPRQCQRVLSSRPGCTIDSDYCMLSSYWHLVMSHPAPLVLNTPWRRHASQLAAVYAYYLGTHPDCEKILAEISYWTPDQHRIFFEEVHRFHQENKHNGYIQMMENAWPMNPAAGNMQQTNPEPYHAIQSQLTHSQQYPQSEYEPDIHSAPIALHNNEQSEGQGTKRRRNRKKAAEQREHQPPRDEKPANLSYAAAASSPVNVQSPHSGSQRLKRSYILFKSLDHHDISISQTQGIWATLPKNKDKVNSLFDRSDEMYAFFSVNGSGEQLHIHILYQIILMLYDVVSNE
jgi:hypothetical protein